MILGMSKFSWSKTIEIVLWVAALGVLVENVSLFRQNRSLQEAAAPQIAAGTQLQTLSGLTLDGRIVSVGFPALGSKLHSFQVPFSACAVVQRQPAAALVPPTPPPRTASRK